MTDPLLLLRYLFYQVFTDTVNIAGADRKNDIAGLRRLLQRTFQTPQIREKAGSVDFVREIRRGNADRILLPRRKNLREKNDIRSFQLFGKIIEQFLFIRFVMQLVISAFEQFNIDEYLKLCEEEKVTVLTGMPPVIHSLTTQDARKYLKTVREIISGGGPLHKKIWKDFHQTYQIPIINAYGLSETIVIGTGTVIRPEDYWEADRFESVGHPVCFSEVKIVDELDSSKILDEYEHGEIALRGPAVAKGYWRNIEKTKSSFLEDGWFLTGDIGYLDSDDRLFITDRKKDMIVMSGWKIYPTEVEEVLIKYPEVKEIAIFSINDCHRGELPVAAVVWQNTPDDEGLLKYARENLSRYKVPRKIFALNELPRVNGWKLLRRELRKMFKQ